MPSGIYIRTKKVKQKLRNILKKVNRQWKNKKYIKKMSLVGKNFWKNKKYRSIILKAVSKRNKIKWKNKKYRKKMKKILSEAASQRIGKLATNWQGGISFCSYSIEFNGQLKRKIRKRDNNICQLCDKRKYGKELSIHHIDYNKRNCREDNLISLCRKCNCIVNGNRDYWFAYFNYRKNK